MEEIYTDSGLLQRYTLGKAYQKNDISTYSYQLKTTRTRSAENLGYNGRLISLYILYKIRCADAKRIICISDMLDGYFMVY